MSATMTKSTKTRNFSTLTEKIKRDTLNLVELYYYHISIILI